MGSPMEQETGPANPDRGRDLSFLVPTVVVAWSAPPSFNDDPLDPDGDGGEGDGEDIPATSPIRMNASSMRAAINQMLNVARPAVDEYERLRNVVLASRHTPMWGQEATVTRYEGGQSGVSGNSYNGAGAGVRTEVTRNSPIRESAADFAAEIGPAQERALLTIADVFGIAGQYIASLNRAGQTYGQADRRSRFPDPPGDPVQT